MFDAGLGTMISRISVNVGFRCDWWFQFGRKLWYPSTFADRVLIDQHLALKPATRIRVIYWLEKRWHFKLWFCSVWFVIAYSLSTWEMLIMVPDYLDSGIAWNFIIKSARYLIVIGDSNWLLKNFLKVWSFQKGFLEKSFVIELLLGMVTCKIDSFDQQSA